MLWTKRSRREGERRRESRHLGPIEHKTEQTMKNEPQSPVLLYQASDGATRLEVRMEDETVWLSQNQMAELFQTSIPNVRMHIRNVFAEGELQQAATVKEFLTVRQEGSRQVSRSVEHYNLDVIISVGYRVKSQRGTQFRIWATQRLREYIVKGFAMDDERLKRAGGGNYFEELLSRIRDIRSSEKVFWRKVLEIYATSIDYDSREEASHLFFATVQNKVHWAAHGHTAAEIVHHRNSHAPLHFGICSCSSLQTIEVGDKPLHLFISQLNPCHAARCHFVCRFLQQGSQFIHRKLRADADQFRPG